MKKKLSLPKIHLPKLKGEGKKQKLLIAVLAVCIVCVAVFGIRAVTKRTTKKTADNKTTETLTDDELLELVSGIEDKYVIVSSESVDLLDNVTFDKDSVIKEVTVDDGEVEYAFIGNYEATYTIIYVSSGDEVSRSINKRVTVVSEQDASKLTAVGITVYASGGNKLEPDEAATEEVAAETEEEVELTEEEVTEDVADNSTRPSINLTDDADVTVSDSDTATVVDSASGDVSTIEAESGIDHEHTWEPVYSLVFVSDDNGGHYENVVVAYQCSGCGQQR